MLVARQNRRYVKSHTRVRRRSRTTLARAATTSIGSARCDHLVRWGRQGCRTSFALPPAALRRLSPAPILSGAATGVSALGVSASGVSASGVSAKGALVSGIWAAGSTEAWATPWGGWKRESFRSAKSGLAPAIAVPSTTVKPTKVLEIPMRCPIMRVPSRSSVCTWVGSRSSAAAIRFTTMTMAAALALHRSRWRERTGGISPRSAPARATAPAHRSRSSGRRWRRQ